MTAQMPVPKDHPLMLEWNAYKLTESYANTRRWAGLPEHVDGSLWAAFEAGFKSGTFQECKMHEIVIADLMKKAADLDPAAPIP